MCEVANGVDAFSVEDGTGPSADSPEGTDGEAVQELDCRVLRDEEEAVWFGVLGGDFGDGFGGGYAHGCG